MTDRSKVFLVLAALAIGGVVVVLWATRPGVGVLPDSTVYFDAAQNLENGRGLVVISGTGTELKPLTHYPPLYSSLLALVGAGGATVETAARWLNAILFGVNVFLVGLSINFFTRNTFWLPVIGSFLTLTAPDMVAMHSVAMTEPVYLALTLGGLLSLGAYLQTTRRALLFLAAVLIALAFLARYVGITGAMTGFIALLLLDRNQSGRGLFTFSFRGESLRRNVSDSLIFGLVSCAPIALWSLRNRFAAGGASDRQIGFHPIKFPQIVSAFSTAAQWLVLGKVRSDVRFLGFVIEILLLAGLAIYVKRLIRRHRQLDGGNTEVRTKLPHLLIIFVVVYVSFLILTITVAETDNVLDSRSLLPVHFAFLVLAPWLVWSVYTRVQESGLIRIVFVLMVLLLAGSYTFRSTGWIRGVQGDGQGYASRAWKDSATVAQIKRLPAGVPIYSNGIDAIVYLTGRRARDIPAKIIHGTGQPNPHYQDEWQKVNDDLRKQQGVVVYFNTFSERWFLPLESELQELLPLTEVAREPDGSLYKMNGHGESGPYIEPNR